MPKEQVVMDDKGQQESVAIPSEHEPEQDPIGSGSVDIQHLATAIEAILLTTDKPIPLARLVEALSQNLPENPADREISPSAAEEGPGKKPRKGSKNSSGPDRPSTPVERAIESLNRVYEETGRAFRIEQVAGGYRLMTLPKFAPVLASFHHSRTSSRLSRAAVETLAIVAYRQPITRAHLEAIRGVACGEVLRSLMERRLVTIKGRSEELGRPMLYGTTKEFLDAFGLASLKDLPSASELHAG